MRRAVPILIATTLALSSCGFLGGDDSADILAATDSATTTTSASTTISKPSGTRPNGSETEDMIESRIIEGEEVRPTYTTTTSTIPPSTTTTAPPATAAPAPVSAWGPIANFSVTPGEFGEEAFPEWPGILNPAKGYACVEGSAVSSVKANFGGDTTASFTYQGQPWVLTLQPRTPPTTLDADTKPVEETCPTS